MTLWESRLSPDTVSTYRARVMISGLRPNHADIMREIGGGVDENTKRITFIVYPTLFSLFKSNLQDMVELALLLDNNAD
jgi:hypothetical protein